MKNALKIDERFSNEIRLYLDDATEKLNLILESGISKLRVYDDIFMICNRISDDLRIINLARTNQSYINIKTIEKLTDDIEEQVRNILYIKVLWNLRKDDDMKDVLKNLKTIHVRTVNFRDLCFNKLP